ncbi:MAG TPA: LytTR family DNA-binding domain-containing protein [Bryobacteraceae bacterium]|jgi:two-component system LytT family response regulator
MMRVMLVDDEQAARERLRQMLEPMPGLEIVGEAADGEEAIQKVVELHPDLLLLDIQMPGCSGLEVAACLPAPRPEIVFCTAFDQYAVDAFEINAVDYLLKPVNRVRLARAIERVRGGDSHEGGEVERALQALRARNTRLLARCGDGYRVVPQQEVVYFLSEGGLTKLCARERSYVLDPTLNDLEGRLDPAFFFRVSRAAIVNLNYVTEVQPLTGGTADVVLTTGIRLEVSRRRLKDLLDRLGGGGLSPI